MGVVELRLLEVVAHTVLVGCGAELIAGCGIAFVAGEWCLAKVPAGRYAVLCDGLTRLRLGLLEGGLLLKSAIFPVTP